MAESTLRENKRGATHQLAAPLAAHRNQARAMVLVQDPFYRHDHLGPGAPLREIPGVSDQAGYYDWAGRRLFLADGEPDPMCPGAYRYQHNPDCCDLEAPDSDPRSPRYEPMHLRHKTGDTWIIDANRPWDPFDPGPYGSHGWYKDERTGRHRRDETPDPLPAEGWVPPKGAWFPGTADWPEPPAQPSPEPASRGADGRSGSSGGSGTSGGGRQRGSDGRDGEWREDPRASGERGGSDRPPPWGQRGRPVPSEPDEPEEPAGPQRPWGARTGGPSPGSDASRRSTRRPWDRTESGDGPGDAGWISGSGSTRASGDSSSERDGEDSGRTQRAALLPAGDAATAATRPSAATGEYRFSKLREDSFDRFIVESAELRAAHFIPQKPYLRERAVWVLHWLAWVLALGLVPMPTPLHPEQHRVRPVAAQPIPVRPGPAVTARTDQPQAGSAAAERPQGELSQGDQSQGDRPQAESSQPAGAADTSRQPGAALAAAVNGARAARNAIADRTTRPSEDLAAAVRNSTNRTSLGHNGNDRATAARARSGHHHTARFSETHWHTQPHQYRPRPTPRPQTHREPQPFARPAYRTVWEHAFDSGANLILNAGGAA